MKFRVFFVFLLCSQWMLGQINQGENVQTLLYFEPVHSDRPGFTYDSKMLRSGIILQTGVFSSSYGEENQLGGNLCLRKGTFFGEFDLNIERSHQSMVDVYSKSTIRSQSSSQLKNYRATLGYRYSLRILEGLNMGGMIGANKDFNEYKSSFTYIDTTYIDFQSEHDVNRTWGIHAFLNIGYSLKNWSISGTFGALKSDMNKKMYEVIMSVNLGYSFKKWGAFVEMYKTDRLFSTQLQTGLTYKLGRDWVIDAFISKYTATDFNNAYGSLGLTYFLR